jgi:hypothetical protein
MPVNVHVGFSRKVGEPNYGSRGASVHLELELDRAALDDPERLQTEIEAIFERARTAVERELERPASPPSAEEGACVGNPDQAGNNGHRQGPRPGPRPATPNQVRALEKIARQRGVDLTQLLYTKFDGRRAEELTIVEASLLIDFLKTSS